MSFHKSPAKRLGLVLSNGFIVPTLKPVVLVQVCLEEFCVSFSRAWYKRSEVNRGQVAVSRAFRDVSGGRKLVTFGWTIHKVKPLTPPDCTSK